MLNTSDDFSTVTDGLESVTLLRRGTNPGGEGVVITHALRRAMETGEAAIVNRGDVHKQVPSHGQQTATDLVWHLPVAELTAAPRIGDIILDAGQQRWTILELKQTTLGTRWRCLARNLAVAFGLDDSIGIEKAAFGKDQCGAAQPQWRTWKTGIRARIQPQETKLVASAEAKGTTVHYRIFVAENVPVDSGCRIIGPDGTIYTITASSGAERIGELQVIEAEVTR